MAVDPRLMMVDYSSLGRAGQAIGQGISGYRMKQTQDLAGKALMGDPSAMAELSQRDPSTAAQVSQRLSEQASAAKQSQFQQQQAQLEYATALSNAQDKFGPMFAKFATYEEAKREHERRLKADPLYQFVSQGGQLPDGTEVAPDDQFTEQDFINARKMYGAGFGDMDFADLVSLYEKNPVTQDMLKTKNSAATISTAYDRLKENPKDQAAQFNVAKAAIQMIESGVVRPEEFAAAAGIALPAGLSGEELVDYLDTKFRGGLTIDQAANLARMGVDAFNAKVGNVEQLQKDLTEAGLGAYDPNKVFATARAVRLPEVTMPDRRTDEPKGPATFTDPESGKTYTFPTQDALNKFMRARGEM